MNKDVSESFESYFGGLRDSRIERHKLYQWGVGWGVKPEACQPSHGCFSFRDSA